MRNIVARIPNLSVMTVLGCLFFIATGAVQAAGESYPDDGFPWSAQSYHWNKFTAETAAENNANIQCNTYGLVRDTQLDQMGGSWSTLDCGIGNCYIATLNYWCEDPPPRTMTRSFFNIEGALVCTNENLNPEDLPSYWALGDAAEAKCDSQGSGWYVKTIFNVRTSHSIPTGSCGDFDGWSVPRKVSKKADIVCELQY